MEELVKKAEELGMTVAKGTTEEELKVAIELAEQELEDKKKSGKETPKLNKKVQKPSSDEIKALDEKNKVKPKDIQKEKKSIEKVSSTRQVKKAKNGEYYEIISEDTGMWSRTGQLFDLNDLNNLK